MIAPLSPPPTASAFERDVRSGRTNFEESTLYSFPGPPGPEGPGAGPPMTILKLGTDLYGVSYGGPYSASAGTVWRLRRGNPRTDVLYDFGGTTNDASHPEGSLVADSAGALYGVSYQGGVSNVGTVFKLTPAGGGYSESVLYSFTGTTDGSSPIAIAIDESGALYASAQGGTLNGGTIVKLTPSGSGYVPQIIYSFSFTDGFGPNALLVNGDGSLYGSTNSGGDYAAGVVFQLTPTGSSYAYTKIYEFQGHYDGNGPSGFLTADRHGTLYGVTYYGGGPASLGTVYALDPTKRNAKERVLYAFQGGQDGQNPYCGVTLGRDGILAGTTYLGGAGGDGTIFELTPTGRGTYAETILHAFAGQPADGQSPISALFFDRNTYYGLTFWGGSADRGILYAFSL